MTTNTPEQARTLWCPMVRLAAVSDGRSSVPGNQSVMNRLQVGIASAVPDAASCIADKCAMWRWANKPSTQAEQSAFDLDQSIDVLALDVRARNALKGEGVFKLNQLVILRSADLWKMPNVGTKTINEIRQSLAAHGLELSTQKKRAHPPGTGYCGIAGRPEVAA